MDCNLYSSQRWCNCWFTWRYGCSEQKARATYEWLLNLTDDAEIKKILGFLEREVVHYQRFGEAFQEKKSNQVTLNLVIWIVNNKIKQSFFWIIINQNNSAYSLTDISLFTYTTPLSSLLCSKSSPFLNHHEHFPLHNYDKHYSSFLNHLSNHQIPLFLHALYLISLELLLLQPPY